MTRRVVITGVGAVCPIGTNAEEFWGSCLDGVTSVSSIPEHWWKYADYKSRIWAPLPPIDYAGLGLKRIEQLQLDPVSLLTLCAAREALQNAELGLNVANERANTYAIEGVHPEHAGVYMGTGLGGARTFLENHCHPLLAVPKERLLALVSRGNLEPDQREVLTGVIERMLHPSRVNRFVVSMTMPAPLL